MKAVFKYHVWAGWQLPPFLNLLRTELNLVAPQIKHWFSRLKLMFVCMSLVDVKWN